MLERIVTDPSVHFSKARVRGTRIPVYSVLDLIDETHAGEAPRMG